MLRLLVCVAGPLIVQALPANVTHANVTHQPGQCQDTNNGTVDHHDAGCFYYANSTEECGIHDDSDFKANDTCCACGGGSGGGATTSPTPSTTPVTVWQWVCANSVYVNFFPRVNGKRVGGIYKKSAGMRNVFTRASHVLYQCSVATPGITGRWYLGDIGAQDSVEECRGHIRSVGADANCPGSSLSWQGVDSQTQEWVSSSFRVVGETLGTPMKLQTGTNGSSFNGTVRSGSGEDGSVGDGSDGDGSGEGPIVGMTCGAAVILLGCTFAVYKGGICNCSSGRRDSGDLEENLGASTPRTPSGPPVLLGRQRSTHSKADGKAGKDKGDKEKGDKCDRTPRVGDEEQEDEGALRTARNIWLEANEGGTVEEDRFEM